MSGDADMPVTVRVPARVGLVGNPSDGYGGAVLAAVVDAWCAEVTVGRCSRGVRITNATSGSLDVAADELASCRAGDVGGAQAIVVAALQALVRHRPLDGLAVDVTWSSSIPRSVGLAGSSAIAVAVVEAVAGAAGLHLDRRVVAALALAAETEGLGIAAGWQDRAVQAARSAVLVDTAVMTTVEGRTVPAVRPVALPRIHALVGWRTDDAEDSGAYHGALRRRAGDPDVTAGMAELAALARRAAACADRADVAGLTELIDAGWRSRCTSAPLRPHHADLVEAARAAGVTATSPGSGGSVVAVAPDGGALDRARDALADAGARTAVVRLR